MEALRVSVPESPKRRALGAISTNTPTKLRESPAKAKFVAALVEAAPAPPLAAVFGAGISARCAAKGTRSGNDTGTSHHPRASSVSVSVSVSVSSAS